MIRHLFWDFDGTLYDSYPLVVRAFGRALEEMHISDALPPEQRLPLLKVSVYHAVCQAAQNAQKQPEDIMPVFRRFHARERDFVPYAGMQDCLAALHAAGFRHYLYTHRDASAVVQLQKDGLWPLFSDAVLRTDGFPDKPAPDALKALMARSGLQPEACAMVGDRDIDILAGHNAGMAGILFDPEGFYPNLDAEMRVSSMAQLQARLLS